MKNIKLFIYYLLLFSTCNYEQEQIHEKSEQVAPVLSIEGATHFVITNDLPDFFYSVLTWSRANFGKGIPAEYVLQVSNDESFTGASQSFYLGKEINLRALTATELYTLAVDMYGVFNQETERKEPATLFFRIMATDMTSPPNQPSFSSSSLLLFPQLFSNTVSITSQWEEKEKWTPVELTIRFKAVSGDWGEYAVYGWGDAEVYGGWPGKVLEAGDNGWYSFVVPTNRPINLIINNNGKNRHFDFLKDPTESLCYAFEIAANDNCKWTAVDCPAEEPALYMIGDDFGKWDWASSGVVKMTPVNGFAGHFWAVRYIEAGRGFKWCRVREWNGDFCNLGEDIGYTVSGGNAYVSKSGMYMVYVDMPNGKISVEPARIYGIGDCFGSWDTSMYPFATIDKTMGRTTTGAGELRIYAASNIAPVGGDWWRMEFVIINGKIAYRGSGGDQPRVRVDTGKLIVLDFNTGVGIF